MSIQSRASRLLGPALCLAVFACSEDSTSPVGPGPDPAPDPPGEEPTDTTNVAPEIGPIADATVVRNTVSPRTLELNLELVDPDDDVLDIVIASDDESVVARQTLECSPGTCAVTLAPSPERTGAANVQVTATDGSGGEAMAEFRLDVSPRLVTNAEDGGPGSLRAAVADAEPGDVIGFDTTSVFAESQTIELQDYIVLDKVLAIEGPGADRLALSGGGAVRILRANEGADVVIRGVTITNGRAPREAFDIAGTTASIRIGGGVVLDTGAKLTLSACAVTDNIADPNDPASYGGGIANLHGTLVANEGTTITGNTASLGGGIANLNVGAREALTRIENAVLADNDAAGGGAIYNGFGLVFVHESVIRENTALRGAGIENIGTLTVEAGSIIADNVATGSNIGSGGGGGIANAIEGTANIIESTVESNTSAAMGGGFLNQGILEIRGATIAGNEAADDGGAIYQFDHEVAPEPRTATLELTTVEANVAKRGGGIFNASGTIDLQTGAHIQENTATEHGGGVYNGNSGTLVLRAESRVFGNTVTQPTTAAPGGGVYNLGTLENAGDISANQPDDIRG